eukprot:CAMPEP_0194488798 /NCGR_PEP_ID=MMETSP0253-20130528/8588_1 /TAXON_ID=2966 /ORGANISM="Noctiluca scintillans" /LENGTH=54 /DNA_ID=CAMNT_0039329201 /DNA_START=325 /DNA_END=489 /DNA_ORIENTATION=-
MVGEPARILGVVCTLGMEPDGGLETTVVVWGGRGLPAREYTVVGADAGNEKLPR